MKTTLSKHHYCLVFCCLLSFVSLAQRPFEFEINIGNPILNADIVSHAGSSYSIGTGLRYNFNSSFSILGNYAYMKFQGDQGGLFSINVEECNALIEWYPLKRLKIENKEFAKRNYAYSRTFQPYLNLGVGIATIHYDKMNAAMSSTCSPFTCFSNIPYIPIQVGGGFRLLLDHNIALNLNASWRNTNTDEFDLIIGGSDYQYFDIRVGLIVFMGKLETL
ncbi:MAG: hypothetical protein AAFP82_00585 [Bacteroidota bacterium]